jgi:hypothetical protein
MSAPPSAIESAQPLIVQPTTVTHVVTPSSPGGIMQDVVLEGYYEQAFEYSGFIPCERAHLPEYEAAYWLDATGESEFYERYSAFDRQWTPDVAAF